MRSLVHQPFQHSASGLACDGLALDAIVAAVGTPVYVYSARAIRDAYGAIDRLVVAGAILDELARQPE